MEGIMALNMNSAIQPPIPSDKPRQSIKSCIDPTKVENPKAKPVKIRRKRRIKKQNMVPARATMPVKVPSPTAPNLGSSKTNEAKAHGVAQRVERNEMLAPKHLTHRTAGGESGPSKQPDIPKQLPSTKGKQKKVNQAPNVSHHQKIGRDIQGAKDQTLASNESRPKSSANEVSRQSRRHQRSGTLRQTPLPRQNPRQITPENYLGIQRVNLAAIDIPAFYRAVNARYQACRAQKTIFVLQKPELAMHNSIARAKVRESLAKSDAAVLDGLKQCDESMEYVLAGRSANKDAHWSAQLQRLRDEYEDALEKQKMVSERLLAQRQEELERWQERVEQLERSSSRFLGH